MSSFIPMRLLRILEPFDHSDWIFEPKMDGFRALAHVKGHHCTLISRNRHTFKSWPQLAEEVAHSVRPHSAILDGEVCCLNPDGTSNFKDLLFRREWPFFLVFDLLAVDGEDIRSQPLRARKMALRRIMPWVESRLRYLDHVEGRGIDLFRVACDRDLEGVVGKWAQGSYSSNPRTTSWVKIKNPRYSQMEGRHELFERRRPEGRPRTHVAPARLALR
jgi:bifunctional non-homologous end joining protein LigD